MFLECFITGVELNQTLRTDKPVMPSSFLLFHLTINIFWCYVFTTVLVSVFPGFIGMFLFSYPEHKEPNICSNWTWYPGQV